MLTDENSSELVKIPVEDASAGVARRSEVNSAPNWVLISCAFVRGGPICEKAIN